jgi:N-acetylglucosamine-6-sulfatase
MTGRIPSSGRFPAGSVLQSMPTPGSARRWLAALLVFAAPPLFARAGPGPCRRIREACEHAGFVQGGAHQGLGLQVNCVRPLLEGATAGRRAARPLPAVDPGLIAACRAQSPKGATKAVGSIPAEWPTGASSVALAPGGHANVVFVLTDDLAWNLVQFMPNVRRMQEEGATFHNFFVTDSLCCPSRTSIFTGRYPHSTGVFRNTGDDGGYAAFRRLGNARTTFATALSAIGYRTAMLGKYLNGYLPEEHGVEPGWTSWAVAGNGYREFDYSLNLDGTVVRLGHRPADYLTDVLSALAVRFIDKAAASPFILEVATFAPHAPYTPAPRDADAFPGLRAPRTAAFDAAPAAGAPRWLVAHPQLSAADVAAIDRDFRKRAQAVLAVDAMIGRLRAAIAAAGLQGSTYVVFSSDNGYHMGEHRLLPGKMTAFDTDIRVPLIVTGPGVRAGLAIDEVAENVDLCPTFMELGGAPVPPTVDGRSLLPLLRGKQVPGWRSVALVEHRGPNRDPSDPDAPALRSGNPTTYEAIRGRDFLYVEYSDGEREHHDLANDPQELRNTFPQLSGAEKASLHATLEAVKGCRGAAACREAGGGGR